MVEEQEQEQGPVVMGDEIWHFRAYINITQRSMLVLI